MIEEQVFNALKSLASNRVYPMVLPQNPTMPAIVYTLISKNSENRLEGSASLRQARMQIDTYAKTYSAVKILAASVLNAMETASFKGTLQTERDLYEADVKLYRVTQDFYIWQRS